MWSEDLGAALKEVVTEPYDMSLVGGDRRACIHAVNSGIDSRLEACFVPDRGDRYTDTGHRLNCLVSVESLPILVRRLLEAGDDAGLASGICDTLGIELI